MSANSQAVPHVLPDALTVSIQERTYGVGDGVDALTGDAAVRRAVNPFTLQAGLEMATDTTLWIKLCESHQDVRSAISLNFDAEVSTNVYPIDISAGVLATIQKGLRASVMSFSMIAHWTSVERDNVLASDAYVLNEEAARRARDEPETFRQVYGDYFVAGQSRAAIFTAILTWKCANNEVLRSTRMGVHAMLGTAPVALTAALGGSLDKIAANNHVELEISIGLVGANGNPESNTFDSMRSVMDHLHWFQQHNQAVPLYNILWHFSRISNARALPKEVPASEAVFRSLESIRSMLFKCLLETNGLPDNVLNGHKELVTAFKARFSALKSECRNAQRFLAQTDALRADIEEKLSVLTNDLEEFKTMYAWWRDLQLMRKLEPTPDPEPPKTALRLGDSSSVGSKWVYGAWSDQSPIGYSTFCHVEEKHVKYIKIPRGFQTEDVQESITVDSNEQLVGWRVQLKSGKGTWRAQKLPIILTQEAAITIRRPPNVVHGSEWRFSVFVVRNKYLGMLAPLVDPGSGSDLSTAENPNVQQHA